MVNEDDIDRAHSIASAEPTDGGTTQHPSLTYSHIPHPKIAQQLYIANPNEEKKTRQFQINNHRFVHNDDDAGVIW